MSINYSPATVTNGLVLCLDAGNTKSYPGSGTAWTDLSGNGNTGTLTNGPTYSSANGGSIVFDGADDYVGVGNITAVDGISQLTISGWVKRNSGFGALFFKNAGSSSNWIEVAWHNSIGLLFVPATISAYAQMAIPSGTDWKFITCVFDGTQSDNTNRAKIYINVVLQSVTHTGTYGTVTGNPNASIIIGRDGWNAATLNASINDVRVYNRALSAAEVRQNFNALRGRYGV